MISEQEHEIKIDLSEKFVNREYTEYEAENSEVERAIISETGFYAIIGTYNENKVEAKLIDEAGNETECYTYSLNSYNENNELNTIIIAEYYDKYKEIKLVVDGKEYILNKKD